MAEVGIEIDIYRNNTVAEWSEKLADPESRPDTGSAAATAAAVAASLLCRGFRIAAKDIEPDGQLDWYVRNSEILRDYMVRLIDEDVKCHGPLRRALKEGDEHRIEASRQAAVSICLEIVNMMGKCLEMAEGLLPYDDLRIRSCAAECAELAFSASRCAGDYILYMSRLSPDDTYRYVMKRENELTLQEQQTHLEQIRSAFSGQ